MAPSLSPATRARAPRWTRLEHDERRRQILACARQAFSERHYGAVSTTEIAEQAGVTRGLLHHYFGTKRDLYLEVVRSMVRIPENLFARDSAGRDREEVLGGAVDRWLDALRHNRETWLATAGAPGFGYDPEVEAILDEAREAAADRVIALVRPADAANAPPELRAVIRAYAGFAEATSLEWLHRRRLNRGQARELLLRGLLQLVDEVLPRVEAAR